ncbi:MAG: hypothetical protein N5P05_002782 [Chroococcopsis gigantea SAG 12.99]|nr:hypothetical protein [Chroococcopsis gigantea SAG 12.99]
MVLRSLHRLSPQALRFLSVDFQQKNCCWLILGVDCPLPYPLFPVYRFVCAASFTGLRSLGCLNPSSRVGQ